jgi:uncharacterized protein (TIGR03435 family)
MLGDRMIAMKTAGLIALTCALGAQPTPRLKFEVASVKPFKDDGVSPRNSHATYGPDGINFGALTLAYVIGEAYQFPVGRIQGPGSLTKETLWAPLREPYDIAAKAEHPVSKDQLRAMLQSLLAERFHLESHRESKTGPVYTLVVAKGGSKLVESTDPDGPYNVSRSPNGYVFRNARMTELSVFLSGLVDRPVVDQAGLRGRYDFVIKPEELPADKSAVSSGLTPDSPSAAAFAEALKRLGLQLIADRAAVDYLVIDRLQSFSEN